MHEVYESLQSHISTARNLHHKRKQVRLTVDLTKYGKGLVPGVEGYTIGEFGIWSSGQPDRFVGVCFPGIKTLDVLWNGLEVIG